MTVSAKFSRNQWLWATVAAFSVCALIAPLPLLAQDAEAEDPQLAEAVEMDDGLSDAERRAMMPITGEYGSEVERRWTARLREAGLQAGENPNDVFIASGIAVVAMEKGAPGWIESRRVAHDIAFQRAKADLVRTMGQTIRRTGNAQFTSNAVFGQGQIQEHEAIDQVARIRGKAVDLTEAAIDRALRELDPDRDPSDFQAMSQPELQVAIEEIFEQATYRAAARVVSGASTFAVLEGPSEDGNNHEILVGLVWSPRLANLAAAIRDGRTTVQAEGLRISAHDLVPQTVGAAVTAMGTKAFIDETGNRAVISFAQAEPARVNPADRSTAERAALSVAEGIAAGQIAAFVSERVAVEDEVRSRQISQVYADFVQRGVEINTQQVETIRAATGTVQVTGVNTIWRQVVQHPETEQSMALVAVVWSPSGQEMGQRMRGAIEAARTGASTVSESATTQVAPDQPGMTFESAPLDASQY